MANDPRRFAIRKPSSAGKMQAQSPTRDTSKAAILSRDLERHKVDTTAPVIRVDTSVGSYDIQEFDQLVECDATVGSMSVRLPLAASFEGRRVIVVKTNLSANAVSLRAQDNDTIVSWVSGLAATKVFTGADRPLMELVSNGISTWYAFVENGTII